MQVAHLIGAKKNQEAKDVFRQSITCILIFSATLSAIGMAISGHLPVWLRGSEEIRESASTYFLLFSACIPLLALEMLAASMLRCTGNIKIPSLLNILMCVLDMIFNYLFIFPTHDVTMFGMVITIPGAGLRVQGAAIGTIIAVTITSACMMYYACFKSKDLQLNTVKGSFKPTRLCINKALRIGCPMGLQHLFMCSAQIFITAIVAPLGSIPLAANSFAVTAESICYMPGYGIADAATTLVGQSLGARRKALTRRFAYITLALGIAIMSLTGALMYAAAPLMMQLMTPNAEIVALGSHILRIEAFAEPMFAASIVCYGIFVGAGDTLMPSILNFCCIWLVRLSLSLALVGSMGLTGVWIAMCIELCVRGVVFLSRFAWGNWMRALK